MIVRYLLNRAPGTACSGPNIFEGKATIFCPQGRGQSSRTPSLCLCRYIKL